ncbi:transposase, partial [Faecalibacillus intestinalis]
MTKEIKKIHKESYEIYGSPKITELLNKKVSQKYVYSIMKENNIKAKYIKPYIQTTVSHDFSDKLKN